MRDAVFLDTAGLLATVRARDSLRDCALALLSEWEAHRTPGVTSELVLTELLSAVTSVRLRTAGASLVRKVLASPFISVVRVHHHDWLEALRLYESRRDKEWSLVDCHSMLICQKRKIFRVFTSDVHFAQAGFTLLLG